MESLQWRRRPEIADFCPLSWSNVSRCHKRIAELIPKQFRFGNRGTSRWPQPLGCTPKGAYGNTAFWEGSGQGSGEGFSEGFWQGGLLWVLQLKRVLRRVLRRGSEKGASRRCLERPLVEYASLGVRPSHHEFPKSTAIQTGGVWQYKWEAYCDTNGRSTDRFPFPQSVGHQKYCNRIWRRTAIEIGGVLRYLFEK